MELTQEIDILLVEDNPQDAELFMRLLQKHHPNERILHVEDGAAALDVLFGGGTPDARRYRSPRVVFLDLKLPKVGGLEVLHSVKTDERTRSIPVIVVTSSGEDSDIRSAYALGANGYVVKPGNYDAFRDAVQRLGAFWLQLNQCP